MLKHSLYNNHAWRFAASSACDIHNTTNIIQLTKIQFMFTYSKMDIIRKRLTER